MIDFTNVKELLVNGESVKEFRVGDSVLWRKRSVLGTSLVLSSDVSTTVGPVTLTAVLQAEDSTFVSGATVTFYDSTGTSLGSGITNSLGVVTCDVVLTETTTIYCSFVGTSDYQACISDTITITIETPLYAPLLDGTEAKTQIGGTTTVSEGIMSGGASYLTDGWSNTGNWKLTFKGQFHTNDGNALCIWKKGETQRDKNYLQIISPYHHTIACITNGTSVTTNIPQLSLNTWYDVTITKTSSTELTVEINNQTYNVVWNGLSNYSNVCIGLDTWSNGSASIKNIIVEAL